MAGGTREIRRRIRSVKNIHQITKAMELVSASKMRRAVQNVLATRRYGTLSWDLLHELARRTDPAHHPLLVNRPVRRIGLILVTSNRGLCGSFNYKLVHHVREYLERHKLENVSIEADLVAVGRRGRDIMFRLGHTLVAEFVKADVTTRIEEVRPMAHLVIDDYLSGRYDRVILAYTDFVSPLIQQPRLRQLLPLTGEPDPYLGSVRLGTAKDSSAAEAELARRQFEYLFEPSATEVLRALLPRLLEMQIYQALLESDASEHSARMLAMRQATDAAHDMMDDLTLTYNQARQSGITAELAEISAGRLALGA